MNFDRIKEAIDNLWKRGLITVDDRSKILFAIKKVQIPREKFKSKTKYHLQEYGFLYILKIEDRYKIGSAKDVSKRLKRLQTSQKPEIVYTYESENYKEQERELHIIFKEKRTYGEWFKLNQEDLDKIKWYCEIRSLNLPSNTSLG